MATTTHNVVKAERKPRRNIQYRDVSSAIAKTDNLEFLVDVVPKTTTYKEYKKKKEEKDKGKGKGKEIVGATNGRANGGGIGQTTLDARIEDEGIAITNGISQSETPQHSEGTPVSVTEKPEETPDVMEVDQPEPERVEDDAVAMQLEMEMRGPPRPTASASPEVRRSGGFTAINGLK